MNETQKVLFDKGMELARQKGLLNVTVGEVCEACDVPVGSFPGRTGWTHKGFIKFLREKGAPLGEVSNYTKVIPDIRREQILEAALKQAVEHGLYAISAASVAKMCEVSRTTVTHHFKRMDELRKAVILYAVEKKVISVVSQGLCTQFVSMHDLDKETQERVTKYLSGE